jgi:hypothetical protein
VIPPGTPFGDGYDDGLHARREWAHLHTEGRAAVKYREGLAVGAQDRAAGALEPVERVS